MPPPRVAGDGPDTDDGRGPGGSREGPDGKTTEGPPLAQKRLRRFYGSVEIDPGARPGKAFEAILEAVVIRLQNASGTRDRLTLQFETEATEEFKDDDVGVVRDNAKQLRLRAESTGFE